MGWKNKKVNLLNWESTKPLSKYFEVERSIDGNDFSPIGRIYRSIAKQNFFEFEDNHPPKKAWYRLKEVLGSSEIKLSKTLRLIREEPQQQTLYLTQMSDVLKGVFTSDYVERAALWIYNSYGQRVSSTIINCCRGTNHLSVNIATLPTGNYFAILQTKNNNVRTSFTKLDK